MMRCGHAEPSPVRISTRVREPALVRNPAEGRAVVVPPVRVGRGEAVGEDPLVRVDGRAEQRLQPARVRDDASDEMHPEAAQLRAVGGERVATLGVREGQVDVEPGAALVGERPPHERREEPLRRSDLLDRRLEHEGAVGRVERGRVLEVDLVLRVHELVVPRERLEAELVRPQERPQIDLQRVGDRTHGVDAGELVDVAAEPVRRGGIALAQEPFELRSGDGNERAARVALDDPPQERPRARGPVVGAVERPCLSEAPGHLGLPRDDAQRRPDPGGSRNRRTPARRRRRACDGGPCP